MIRSVIIESTIFSKAPCYYRDCASAPTSWGVRQRFCRAAERQLYRQHLVVSGLVGGHNRARERLSASVPLGRFGTPAEVAALYVYLLSDEPAFVTGAELVLEGGLTAQ
jgi:NAD(P)-dependent dehydrogenase (short-subunit alcohol dehydrogenase family)